METTLKELQERHSKEFHELRDKCPHKNVEIEEAYNYVSYGGKLITLRCKDCELNLLGYAIERNCSYLSYVRDAVKDCKTARDRVK